MLNTCANICFRFYMYQLQLYRDRCIETAVHNCIKQLQKTGVYNGVRTSQVHRDRCMQACQNK